MTLCSIIGEEELNFRVRNGVGCTLFSMAAKFFLACLLDSGGVTLRKGLGHVFLYTLPSPFARLPCQNPKFTPKSGFHPSKAALAHENKDLPYNIVKYN